MGLEEQRFKVIKLLKEVEKAASELYRLYSEKFSDHKEFWQQLAEEEEDHVRLIHELGAMIADNRLSYNEKEFQVEELQIALDLIRINIDIAKVKKISLVEALSIGLKIEDIMAEKLYYKAFNAISTDGEVFISGIINAEKRHRDTLQNLLDQQGG
jgi:rubrerythrin